MKNAIILHGTGSNPSDYWLPYLQKKLENLGYQVWVPSLPNSDEPALDNYLPFILSQGTFTEETIIVGHSSGAQVILSVLEALDTPIKKAILVAGYADSMENANGEKPELNWELIKSKAQEFIFINSDNDPWGWDDKQGKILQERLGGKLIINHEGHMGSTTYNQPYHEFPLLVELIK